MNTHKNTLVVLLAIFLFTLGCGDGTPAKPSPPGVWVSRGGISVKVSSAKLGRHFNTMDKTGLTMGMPKLEVDFEIRNDSNRNITVTLVECVFADGDTRRLGQAVIPQKAEKVPPGQTNSFSLDTNGYGLNPESCLLVIKPSITPRLGPVKEFVFNISQELSPEQSARERKRREAMDRIDAAMRKGG